MNSKVKKLLLVGLAIVLLAVIGIALLITWGMVPISRPLPDSITVEAVQATYPELLQRLTEAAFTQRVTSSELEPDRTLTEPPEILEAMVGKERVGWLVIGNKQLAWKQSFSEFARPARLGRPRINRYWYTLKDGREVVAAHYEATVLRADGQEGTVIIIFDLEALDRRLQAK